MKLSERHLIQLAAVLDAGGVSEGAAVLGLSQPAVSRSLSMLEARVGEPLFVKGKRPLQATEIGRQLATHGRTMLMASRKASDLVQGFVKGTKGTVRVGGVPFFMDAIVSRLIAEFQNREPDIMVQQSYGHYAELAAALKGDQIDLAVVPLGLTEADPAFEFIEILPGRNIVACRVGHPLLRKRRLATTDLTDFPWVAPLPGSPLLSDLHAILLAMGIPELSIRYSGGSLMSVMNYMAETTALAVLPHSCVFAHRKENRITVLPFDIPQPNRSLGLLRRAGTGRSLAADRFAAHITTSFDDLRHLIKRHENAIVWGR
ncbi:MAG: LysR family transcriptional regulator [Paracoccaceae bacterium]|nr:MAG: LysR family transcriptional regulator [Paracoccaceae bacterium]